MAEAIGGRKLRQDDDTHGPLVLGGQPLLRVQAPAPDMQEQRAEAAQAPVQAEPAEADGYIMALDLRADAAAHDSSEADSSARSLAAPVREEQQQVGSRRGGHKGGLTHRYMRKQPPDASFAMLRTAA